MLTFIGRAEEVVTWIKVEHPQLDMIGVVLGAFALTGVFVLGAMLVGAVLGLTLIRRRARETAPPTAALDLKRRS
jgi:hypothetical protein